MEFKEQKNNTSQDIYCLMFNSLACDLLQEVLECFSHGPEDKFEIKAGLWTDKPSSSSFVLSDMGMIGDRFKVEHSTI